MKIKIIYFLVLVYLFYGCSSKNVLKLNDAIVKANDELRIASDLFNAKLIGLMDLKITEIEKINADIPGGKAFKEAFIDYYNFEKEIFSNEYKEICTLKGENADNELLEIANNMQSKAEKEDRLEANIHTQQQNFAKKNNLKLQ